MIRKLVVSTLCILSGSVFATDYPVTTTDDSGAGSLRDAIESLATSGDTITFDDSLSGTILLQSALPVIAFDTVITGPTMGSITIDGNAAYQIFEINSYTSISNLNLTNNDPLTQGSAILVDGFGLLMLDTSVIDHCSSSCEAPVRILENGGLFTNNVTFSPTSTSGVDVYFEDGAAAIFGNDDSVQPQIWIDGTGTGVIYKEGVGTCEVKAQSTVDVLMVADEGKLVFSDTTLQPVYSIGDAIFEGTPTVFYLGNLGNVQTGVDFGTIENTQNYYQDIDTNLRLKIDDTGNCDLVHADAVGHLAGNLIIELAAGSYTTSTAYTLMTCDDGFSNPFDNVYFDMGSGLESVSNASLSYTSDSVVLTITSDFTVPTPSFAALSKLTTEKLVKTKRSGSPVSKLYRLMMSRKKRQGKEDVIHLLNSYPKKIKAELLAHVAQNDNT